MVMSRTLCCFWKYHEQFINCFDLLPCFVFCPQKSGSRTTYTAEKSWNLMIGQNNFSFKKPRRMEERLDFQFLSVQQKHNYNLQ